MAILVVSVLPAPDSPLTIRLWLRPSRHISLYALSAVRKMCGSKPSWCSPLRLACTEKMYASGGAHHGFWLTPKPAHRRIAVDPRDCPWQSKAAPAEGLTSQCWTHLVVREHHVRVKRRHVLERVDRDQHRPGVRVYLRATAWHSEPRLGQCAGSCCEDLAPLRTEPSVIMFRLPIRLSEECRVWAHLLDAVALAQVMQDGGLVQVAEAGQVVDAVQDRRVRRDQELRFRLQWLRMTAPPQASMPRLVEGAPEDYGTFTAPRKSNSMLVM